MDDVLPANSHADVSNHSVLKEIKLFRTEGEKGLEELWGHSCSLLT
jgi:hypothetical protein